MSVPFQYGVGYVPGDHDSNIIYFDAFSGYPTSLIIAIVVYPSAPSPVTVTGYLSYNSAIVTQFNVTSGAIRNDQTPDLVTFYFKSSRWQLVQTLTPSHFAISSALSADGSTIISGSDKNSFPACIFRLIDGQFQEVTTIPPSSQGYYFGEEVAVDARGQVFGISCTNGNIKHDTDHISGLDSKLVTFDLRSSVDVQGNVYVSGTISGNFPVRTNQTGSTIDVLASDYYIGVNGTGVTVTLPNTGVPTGKTYVIKDESGNASVNPITLSGNGNTIDGSATLTMVANYMSLQVIWTGSFWSII